jgi:alkanesulfonate monooxygenase SsuD/methylene tetrahydromethanopterin reductase-like flavin-dependent oxidoreductase (luciferase family)
MLTRNGFGAEVDTVQEAWKQGMKSAIEAVSEELLEATSIVGTPQEIPTKLDKWVTAGVDEPILSIPAGSPDEAGEKLAALMQALKG